MRRSQHQCNKVVATTFLLYAAFIVCLNLPSWLLFQPALASSEVSKQQGRQPIITNRKNSFFQRRGERNDDANVDEETEAESDSILDTNNLNASASASTSATGDGDGNWSKTNDVQSIESESLTTPIQEETGSSVGKEDKSWLNLFMWKSNTKSKLDNHVMQSTSNETIKIDESNDKDEEDNTESESIDVDNTQNIDENEEITLDIDQSNEKGIDGYTRKEDNDDASSVIVDSISKSTDTNEQSLQNGSIISDEDEDKDPPNNVDNTKEEEEGEIETLSKGKEKSSSPTIENSLRKAFPFFRRRTKEPKIENLNEEINQPLNETASATSIAPIDSTDSVNSTDSTDSTKSTEQKHPPQRLPEQPMSPMMPMMPSSSSLIFIPPPPPRSSGRSASGMPSGPMPVSPTEATLTSLISAILPLVVRLLLITFLSSSSIFGHGDMHVFAPQPSQHFVFERLNDRYFKDNLAMKKALEHQPPEIRSKHLWKLVLSRRRNELKKKLFDPRKSNNNKVVSLSAASTAVNDQNYTTKPQNKIYSRTVIVLNVETMENSMDAMVENLRDSVSCILRQYKGTTRLDMGTELEVVFCIESPGGVVQDFGLAADQLTRLREAGKERGDLIVTVCVDKIAASGGYMMACQASPGQLVAAPFAILGSIGVLRETINVHDVLEKYGIRPLMMKAGEAKAPLTATTKVTDESLELVQQNLDRIHDAFRDMVAKARSEALDESTYEKVTNGDVFLGKHALEYGLVDKIMSSDEYISKRIQAGDRVLRMHKYDKSRMGMRFSPLDILLLKSNGILGKTFVRKLLNSTVRAAPFIFKCSTSFGLMKVIEKNFTRANNRDGLRHI